MADKCKECGCVCGQCSRQKKDEENHADVHLHVEIENLRQRLLERDSHIVTMETQFLNEADKFPNGELASIKEDMLAWQDKYSRLYEAHKRVQKVNQNLEDKLLRIVDKCETEKSAFTKDIATLSHRLADANYTIHRLTQDNEKYRNDVNLAIQLLQCKPSNFVGQRYDSLPSEVQAKVRTYVAQKRVSSNDAGSTPDVKSITVPISTFPPTAMVYNVTKTNNVEKDSDEESDDSKPPVDIVSAAIMAKVLEERERERVFAKHCDTCTCHRSILTNDAETQTFDGSDDGDSANNRDNLYLDNVNYNNHNHHHNHSKTTSNDVTQTTNNRYLDNNGDRKSVDKVNSISGNHSAINGKQSNVFEMQYVNEKTSNHNKSQIIASSRKLDNYTNVKTGEKQSADNSMVDTKMRKSYYYPQKEDDADSGKKKLTTTNCQYSPLKLSEDTISTIVDTNYEEKFILSANVRQTNGVTKKLDHHRRLHNQQHQPANVYRSSKTNSEWTKYEQIPCQEIDLIDLKQNSTSQRQIDVINNRISKNEDVSGAKWNSAGIKNQRKYDDVSENLIEDQKESRKNKPPIDDTLDVINERVWKTVVDGSARSDKKLASSKPRLTLIEVKPLTCKINSPSSTVVDSQRQQQQQQNESSSSSTRLNQQQSEDTASPSFSSDSLVISSSDPPSTSSEFCNNSRITLNKISTNNVNCNNNVIINNNNNNKNNFHNNNNNQRNNNSNKHTTNNNNNNSNNNSNNSLMSNWQDRTAGPRGCSMRITPGSNNILLDNAGHYQTILYTSGGNGNGKPSTALVHNIPKSVRSGESASTSSEDNNSPVLPSDNAQLQRVAEWIKASGTSEVETSQIKSLDSLKVDKKLSDDDMSVNTLNKALSKMKDNKSQQQQNQSLEGNSDSDNMDKGKTVVDEDEQKIVKKSLHRSDDKGDSKREASAIDLNNHRSNNRFSNRDIDLVKDSENGDLISFESSTEEIDDFQELSSSSNFSRRLTNDHRNRSNLSIDEPSSTLSSKKIVDVKITKEMEETYLKLAASLDPANLELSSSESAAITIEKYRNKYKQRNNNFQKHIDKNSGSTS